MVDAVGSAVREIPYLPCWAFLYLLSTFEITIFLQIIIKAKLQGDLYQYSIREDRK